MKFESSPHFESLNPHKVELPFGNYFFCKKFVIAEPFEGIHFTWKNASLLIDKIFEYYGEDVRIAYIANRINAYSIDPQNWQKLEKQYDLLVASAIVSYNNGSYLSASVEKQFTSASIKRCFSLDEAIKWVNALKELN